MSCTTPFCKSTIRGHKPRQHGRDQLTRIADRLPRFSGKGCRVSDKISMHGSRQFNADLDWSFIWKRPNLELGHFTLCMARERDRD